MAVSGEDKTMKSFFDSLLQSAANLEVSKAVKDQADKVTSTVGKHVDDVLGEVSEVTDFMKDSFKNTYNVFKGFFTDINNSFGGLFSLQQADEQAYQVFTGKKQDDIEKNTKFANKLFIEASDEQESIYQEQLRVMQQTRDAVESMDAAFDKQLRQMIDEMDKSNDIAEDTLKQTRKEELERIRKPKKKGVFSKIIDLITGIIFAPLALIGGLIAGFVSLWVKTISLPFKLLKGLRATKLAKIILKPFELLMAPFKFLLRNPIIKAVFGFGKVIGKALFPLFLIIDGLLGLSKFRKIFGKGAGIREAIESTVAGIVSGFTQIPAMALDWLIKKITGIETDFASYFSTENIAQKLHGIITWIDESIVQPIKDFFHSDTWDMIKDEMQHTLDALGLITEKLTKVIRETFEFWSEKFQGLIDLMFKETEVEKRYREKELAGTAPVDVGIGEADIGLRYSKKEGEDIMALGATAEERRAALAAQQEMRRKEAQEQHDALMGKIDKLIEVTEIYSPGQSFVAPTNINTGAGRGNARSQEPREQVAGVQHNSALP